MHTHASAVMLAANDTLLSGHAEQTWTDVCEDASYRLLRKCPALHIHASAEVLAASDTLLAGHMLQT